MALRKTVIRGVSQVGAVRADEDVSFGKTTPNGATVAFQPSQLEVESGQSTFLEDIFVTSNRVEVTFRLIFANLVNIQEVLGIASSALTGDLSTGGGPTEEKLVIADTAIVSRTDALFLISPGPLSTRRYDFARTKVKGNLTIEASRDQHLILEGTWAVLSASDDGSVNPVEITDSI
jgi:hypothetical protein